MWFLRSSLQQFGVWNSNFKWAFLSWHTAFPKPLFLSLCKHGFENLPNESRIFVSFIVIFYIIFHYLLCFCWLGKEKKKKEEKKDEINTILSQMLHFQGEMNNNVATKDCKITAFDRNSVWDDKYLRYRVDSGMDVQGTLSVLFFLFLKKIWNFQENGKHKILQPKK